MKFKTNTPDTFHCIFRIKRVLTDAGYKPYIIIANNCYYSRFYRTKKSAEKACDELLKVFKHWSKE